MIPWKQWRILFAMTVLTLGIMGCGSKENSDSVSEAQEQNLKILFLGNSYTYVNQLDNVAETIGSSHPGHQTMAMAVAYDGYTFERHWDDEESHKMLNSRQWDYVVLQELSEGPLRYKHLMLENAGNLHQVIEKAGAQTLLFMTWARRGHPEELPLIVDAYTEVGRELGVPVAPVGEAWALAQERRPDVRLHMGDGMHPSKLGTYLTACVILESMGQKVVTQELKSVSEQDQVFLQTIAREAVRQHRQPS